jgi:HEAT repeat protein
MKKIGFCGFIFVLGVSVATVCLAESTTQELIKELKEDSPKIRANAAKKLGKRPDDKSIVVPTLIEALKDEDGNVRFYAAEALGRIKDPSAVPALIEASKDEVTFIRENAIQSLVQIGDPSAVPVFIEALNDTNTGIRWHAIAGLAKLGDESVIPALLEVGNPRATAGAISEIRRRAKVLTLIAALKDSSPEVRRGVASALGSLKDKSAIPALKEALKDSDEEVRYNATKSLMALGDKSVKLPTTTPEQRRQLEEIIKQIKESPNPQVRAQALSSLAFLDLIITITPEVGAMVTEAINGALKDSNWKVRLIAVSMTLDPDNKKAIPILTELMEDEYAEVRVRAAASLGIIGDESVVHVLKKALKDPDPSVRHMAAEALKEIQRRKEERK